MRRKWRNLHKDLDAAEGCICSVLLAVVLLAGCAPPPVASTRTVVVAPPVSFPAADYVAAAGAGEPVLAIDPSISMLEIAVGRAGPLAAIGHDHLVASHSLRGFVAPRLGRADLYVMLDELTVDEPALRDIAGMPKLTDADAIAGTRRNMLEKVLETQKYPAALIAVRKLQSDLLELRITLKGVTRSQQVPARIEEKDGAITIRGALTLRQSDFGIAPFAALGGALQVADELRLRYVIKAQAP
jgi:hypothetical protein